MYALNKFKNSFLKSKENTCFAVNIQSYCFIIIIIIRVIILLSLSQTLASNKTHKTATKYSPWLHLYISRAMVTILDCWPCSRQP